MNFNDVAQTAREIVRGKFAAPIAVTQRLTCEITAPLHTFWRHEEKPAAAMPHSVNVDGGRRKWLQGFHHAGDRLEQHLEYALIHILHCQACAHSLGAQIITRTYLGTSSPPYSVTSSLARPSRSG